MREHLYIFTSEDEEGKQTNLHETPTSSLESSNSLTVSSMDMMLRMRNRNWGEMVYLSLPTEIGRLWNGGF